MAKELTLTGRVEEEVKTKLRSQGRLKNQLGRGENKSPPHRQLSMCKGPMAGGRVVCSRSVSRA